MALVTVVRFETEEICATYNKYDRTVLENYISRVLYRLLPEYILIPVAPF